METKEDVVRNSPTVRMLLVLVLTLSLAPALWASGDGEEAATSAEKEYVIDPTTGLEVLKPQYGGTITWVSPNDPPHTDSWIIHHVAPATDGVVEMLAHGNWGVDRSVHDLRARPTPTWLLKGNVAESWSLPDATTIVFKIRQNIFWHDKEPMNGRQLTAKDVEWNFHRYLGLGSGFTEPSAAATYRTLPWESVTATDDFTVVFKLSQPSISAENTLLTDHTSYINPPEVVEQHGDLQDWRNLVGTGPWMLVDWVDDSSLTWIRNPDYWGHDEKFPENQLPYADEMRNLVMPEEATRVAALRSGAVDFVGYSGDAPLSTVDQADALQRTNPEIRLNPYSYRSDISLALDVRKPPFDDVRVRHAVQMALDLEEMNETIFGGWAEFIPQGVVGQGVKGYVTPFEEWDPEIKQYYEYNPEGAEALLDEAGYPRGADGVRFSTEIIAHSSHPKPYVTAVVSYLEAIGIDLDLQPSPPDGATWASIIWDHTYEGILMGGILGYDRNALVVLGIYESTAQWNFAGVQDPEYDRLIQAARDAQSQEEQAAAVNAADDYAIRQHWVAWTFKQPKFSAWQPWLIGYNGEYQLALQQRYGQFFARFWLDLDLKAEMAGS